MIKPAILAGEATLPLVRQVVEVIVSQVATPT